MRAPLLISATLHGALLLGAVVWGAFFQEPPEPPEPVMQVELTQLEELTPPKDEPAPEIKELDQSLASPEFVFDQISRPDIEQAVVTNDITGPDTPSDPDQTADLTELRELARNRIVVNNTAVEAQQQDTSSQDASPGLARAAPTPRRPGGGLSRPGGGRPGAPSVNGFQLRTSTSSPKPPAEETVVEPSEPDTPPAEEDGTPDAAEVAPTELAMAPPRPNRTPPVQDTETQDTSVEDLIAEAEADTAATAGDQADADPGPPLTETEKSGVRIAFESVWSVGSLRGLPNYEDLVVTVGFKLNKDGSISGEVFPINPETPEGPYGTAFALARRAVMQAAQKGLIQLPADKYAHWKDVEVTFDPGQGIGGF